MKFSEVTGEWLKKQHWQIQCPDHLTIKDVYLKELMVHLDGRGDVTELWSTSWKNEGLLQPAHIYQSATDFGVVKSWHLHEKHTDQFAVTRGKLQVSLVDLRQDSSTFLQVNTLFLGEHKPRYLRIPPGIMHGWKALSFPETLVINMQTDAYDPKDEFRFDWNCVLEHIWQPKNG